MVKFPLTHAMCDKNDYENLEGDDVLVMLQVRYGKLMSVVIYQETAEGEIRVFSFEVTSDCHLLDFGTNAMNELKTGYKFITLNSLPESKIFYEKQGFDPNGENSYIWRRHDTRPYFL
jgi:hypothetical protein